MEKGSVMENLQIQMGLFPMKASGPMTNHRLKEQCNIQMDATRVSLWMKKSGVRENLSILTAHTTKEYSEVTSLSMEKEP